jgi:diguanylate cyclase (GGDEF)-like protein
MPPEDPLTSRLNRLAAAAALTVIALGAINLFAWVAGIDWIRHPFVRERPMMASMALALLMLGVSLWLVRDPSTSGRRRTWSRVLAALVVVGAVIAALAWVVGVEFGIDALLDDESVADRPAAHGIVAVIGVGLWLLVLDHRGRRWRHPENAASALAGLAVLAAIVGYLFGADYISGMEDETAISPGSIVGLFLLWAGTFVARPEGVWMRTLISAGPGGQTVRRLVPVLIGVPILCGAIVIVGVEGGAFPLRVGVAFVVATAIGVFTAISFATAGRLERVEAERRSLAERLTELVDRDPLTGVYNRRRLDEELRRQLAMAQRREVPVALLALDLDGFKPINDNHGHAAGDQLLIQTAETLRTELRESDFICRLGGDEFIVVLPDTDADGARVVAGKLIGAMRGVARPQPDGRLIELRGSIGIATSEESPWIDPAGLLAAADRALYTAKQAGGDTFAAGEGLVLD